MLKIYNSNIIKYGGLSGDNFGYKLNIFKSYCKKAGILKGGLNAAFSFILKEDPLDYYFANQQKGLLN